MWLDPDKCQAGDILLFYGLNAVSVAQGIVTTLKTLTVLPAIASLVQGGTNAYVGSAGCNHAVIISKIKSLPPHGFKQIMISHATGGDPAIHTDSGNGIRFEGGGCQVFRLKIKDYPGEAAKVANLWADDTGGIRGPTRYSFGKAFCCPFRSSSYGSGAKARAKFYRLHRGRKDGPPGFQTDYYSKSMFCSMFVAACYQAGIPDADQVYTEKIMGVDAKNTSPMYLDGYLKNNSLWEMVNAMAGE